jgi:hypothetical protein
VYRPKARLRRLSKPEVRAWSCLEPQHLDEFGGLAQELPQRRLPVGTVALVRGKEWIASPVSGGRRPGTARCLAVRRPGRAIGL